MGGWGREGKRWFAAAGGVGVKLGTGVWSMGAMFARLRERSPMYSTISPSSIASKEGALRSNQIVLGDWVTGCSSVVLGSGVHGLDEEGPDCKRVAGAECVAGASLSVAGWRGGRCGSVCVPAWWRWGVELSLEVWLLGVWLIGWVL